MTDDIQYATAALRAGVSLLEGFGVTQGARIGMMREAIERLSMPMVEMQDDFLIKIETGETISWGEFKERQNVEAIGAGREEIEAAVLKAVFLGFEHGECEKEWEPDHGKEIARAATDRILAALSPASPARTPMGEGAKPAAWMYSHDGMDHDDECPETITRKRWPSCKEPWTEEALYTHPAPTPMGGPQVLKGVGKINGEGWKDTTTIGEVVYVWNAEKPSPYAPGQYPRIGNEGWSASTAQYDFSPASVDEVRALAAPTPMGGDREHSSRC